MKFEIKTMRIVKRHAISILGLMLLLSLSACQGGLSGVNVGVWGAGGGDGMGVGMGMGFPIGGRAEQPQKIELPQYLPFTVGELVAENDLYYRRFLSVTPKGAYVVQDFYKPLDAMIDSRAEIKLTDAYVLQTLQSVEGSLLTESISTGLQLKAELLQWLEHLDADGIVILWFTSGNKAVIAHYKTGLLHGSWQQWYKNGQKAVQGTYTTGKQTGRWSYWDAQGTLIEERVQP